MATKMSNRPIAIDTKIEVSLSIHYVYTGTV